MAARFRPLLVSLGLGVLGVLPVPASGALLASHSDTIFPLFGVSTSSFDYDLCLDPSESCQGPWLFDSLVLSAADAGSVFTATSATDPGFAAFAANLTNGSSDRFISRKTIPGDLRSRFSVGYEWYNFAGAGSASSNGIDLFGFAIERVEFEVSPDFTLTQSPGPPPVYFPSTIISGTVTIRVFGDPIPEPATAMLLGGGLLLLGSRRRSER
jgi:hypothetical protein